MRISDWSSDVCSSDLILDGAPGNRRMDEAGIERQHVVGRNLVLAVHDARHQHAIGMRGKAHIVAHANGRDDEAELARQLAADDGEAAHQRRSEEHTSALQSLMRISYAVFCMQKRKTQ